VKKRHLKKPLHDLKNFNKVRIEGSFLNIIGAIYLIPHTNIILPGNKRKLVP
jgi:hypothetical protein